MTKQRISNLIEQEVKKPTTATEESSALAKPLPQGIATTQTTQMAELNLTGKSLFQESQELWEEIVAFDKEHQLSGRVGAQLWRLGKLAVKPAFILSVKGIRAAFVTASNPENRAALAKWFARSKPAQESEATLEPVEK